MSESVTKSRNHVRVEVRDVSAADERSLLAHECVLDRRSLRLRVAPQLLVDALQ